MEPIPETAEVMAEYGPALARGGEDPLRQLQVLADRVRLVVPECVGMSIATLQHGVTLTLVATGTEIAALDGVQYLADGPCVAAVEVDQVVNYKATDPLDEQSWQLFAESTARAGITSTLTLPIVVDEEVVGSVNLYAATPDAFDGKHESLATILAAHAPGAVTNADLDFSTRRTAEQAPQLLHGKMRIEVAVGIIVASENVDPETARGLLSRAAQRAGVSEGEIAKMIIGGLRPGGPESPDTDLG